MPVAAREAIVRIGMFGATGIVKFDQLSVKAIERRPEKKAPKKDDGDKKADEDKKADGNKTADGSKTDGEKTGVDKNTTGG